VIGLKRLGLFTLFLFATASGCGAPVGDFEVDPGDLLGRFSGASSPDEQLAILDSLSGLPPPRMAGERYRWTGVLLPLIEAREPVLAAKAAELLSQWGQEGTTPALGRLLVEPDPMVRLSAATSLALMADPTAAQVLSRATRDPNATVRAVAYGALGRRGVKTPDREAWEATFRAGLSDPDGAVRAATVRALASEGASEEVPALLVLLDDPDPGVVRAAQSALGKLGDSRAIPSLVAMLQDEAPATRETAARALGYLGDRAAVLPLTGVLRKDEDPAVRFAALESLRALGDPAALEALLGALADPHSPITYYVPAALAASYRPTNLGTFFNLLEESEPAVRAAVSRALGLAGEQRAVLKLIDRLADPDRLVRQRAAEALGALEAAEAVEPLRRVAIQDRDRDTRRVAARALQRMDYASP
jgi:HEAT repeat protein